MTQESKPITVESLYRRLKIFDIEPNLSKTIAADFLLGKYCRVRIERENVDDAFLWCNNQFGENWIWSSPSHTDYTDIFFLDEESASLFKLKFSSVSSNHQLQF